MKLEAARIKKFSRHEKFAPRYLWPKKAYDSCSDLLGRFNTDPGIDALIVKLAVGKNMVRSIRYWGQAFRIFTEEKQKGRAPTRSARACNSHSPKTVAARWVGEFHITASDVWL